MLKRTLGILLVSVALLVALGGIAPLLADTGGPASGSNSPPLPETRSQPGPEAGIAAAGPKSSSGDPKVVAEGTSGNAAGVVAPSADSPDAAPRGLEQPSDPEAAGLAP